MQPKTIPILLILSVGSIAMFGFLGMSFVDHSGNHLCPVSLMAGNNCPPAGSALTFTSHHLSGLQYIVQSAITTNLSLVISYLLIIALLTLVFSQVLRGAMSRKGFPYRNKFQEEEIDFITQNKFLRWFALHNTRDSFASF